MTPGQKASAAELARIKRNRNIMARETISAPRLLDEIAQIKEKLAVCEPDDIQRLNSMAAINFKLLNKVMPDLKPIEMDIKDKETVVVQIDDARYEEIRRKMLAHNDV